MRRTGPRVTDHMQTNFLVDKRRIQSYNPVSFRGDHLKGLHEGGRTMARRPTDGPTEAELEVLSALWERGPSTVNEVNEALNAIRPTGKTTTLKIMQIMVEKGILARDESVRPQVFRPRQSKEKTQARLVRRLLQRAFDGSAAQLVLRVLSDHDASEEELAEIRRMLDEMEDKG